MFKKIGLAVIGLGAVAYSAYWYLGIGAEAKPETARTASVQERVYELNQLEVEVVEPQTLTEKIQVSGTLRPLQSTVIRAKTAGTVEDVFFKVGDRVKKGDILVKLDSTTQALAVDQGRNNIQSAEERVNNARDALNRAEALNGKGYMSPAALENLRYEKITADIALTVGKSQLEAQIKALEDTVLVAPHDGVIGDRKVEPSETVGGNVDLISVVNTAELEIAVEVPTRAISHVSIGDTVELHTDASDGSLKGSVMRIAPAANETSRSVTVFLTVQNTEQKAWPGTFATGEIVTKAAENVIAIPLEAVISEGAFNYILKITDNKIEKAAITVGETWEVAKKVTVVEGLNKDDTILVRPLRGLSEGSHVKMVGI